MFMNDLFMNCAGAAYRIAIFMIPVVPDNLNAQVRNDRWLKARVVARLSNNP